jgi:hypothetical protein
MAIFSYSAIENAFLYVSSAPDGEVSAAINKITGEIHYSSEYEEFDDPEDEERPDWKNCKLIPHKNDLELGRELVFEFVEENIPGAREHIRQIFSHAGAYSRFRAVLDQLGMLQK